MNSYSDEGNVIGVNKDFTDKGTDERNLTTNSQLFKFLKFPTIGSDNIIPTHSFLDACTSLIDFVAILGPVFIPVRSDIGGNVDKLTKIVATMPSQFTTINSIIHSETSKPSAKQIGIDALLWLTRALQYMDLFLRLLVDDYTNGDVSNDLTKHFTQAYDSTLRKYHNWIVQNLVYLSLKATPSRLTILNLLSPGIVSSTDKVELDKAMEKCLYLEMSDYRKLVEINIDAVHRLYDSLNIEY